jgi:hypothetical protein
MTDAKAQFYRLNPERREEFPTVYFARELERENAALRKALGDAATSLRTISQQAGRTEELEDMSQVRGYAFSRYSAAIDAVRNGGGAT